jgi:pimeloyl-ACP methyl ester carboxylesterase
MGYAQQAVYELRDADRPELVIALHGLTADHRQPLALLDGPGGPGGADGRFAVLAPDLRGHGDTRFTGAPAAFRPADLAGDVLDLVAHLGLRPRGVRVVGISMGATVALELVRSGRLPVDAAVYVRPAHGAAPPRRLAVNAVIARLLREDPVSAPERLLTTAEYQSVAAVSERHAASLRRKTTPADPERQALVLEQGAWIAFPRPGIEPPGPPSLVVAAERDPLHPVEIAREWATRLPGARLEIVPADDGDAAQAAGIRRAAQEFLRASEPTSSGVRT